MPLEQDLIPYQATDLRGERVLVLAPHPDDETMGCGGCLILHRRYGDPVRVVFVTSGERGDWQGLNDAEKLRTRREAEAGRALAFLGIDEWEFWRLPDRGVEADGALVERIVEATRAFGPTLVYAPAPLEIHPDHRALAQALRAALRGWPTPLRVALYEVGFAAPINTLVDVSSVWEVKEQAIRVYESQLSGPNYLAVAEGLARFRALTLGSKVTTAEGFRIVSVEKLEADPVWRWQALQDSRSLSSKTPAVSVIVRTKDRPQFLREALGSLAAQTFRDFEVVIVNDAGQDVGELVAEYPMLETQLIQLETNQGRGAASNAGVKAARGEFIAYLDDDDLYYPQHLEILYGFLSRNDHFGGAYADAHVAQYKLSPESLRYELMERRIAYSQDFDRELLLYRNYIPNLCLMHRREAYDRAGQFDPHLEVLEDWDFVLRLAQQCPLHHISRCTAEYRIRDDRTNLSVLKPWGGVDEFTTRTNIYKRYWEKHTPETEARVYGKLMEEVWQLRRRAESSPNAHLEGIQERNTELDRDNAELSQRVDNAEQRCQLLENEAESLSSELLITAHKVHAQAARISSLTVEQKETRQEITRLHQEVASRQQLIDSIRATRTWKWRMTMRRLLTGRGE